MSGSGRSADTAPVDFDEPTEVAEDVLALDRPGVLVLDCDGVLAPITEHADDSVLLDGVDDLLGSLGSRASDHGLTVAVLSGRSLAGLEQFGFPDGIEVLGSYGGERRGRPPVALDTDEQTRLDLLTHAAEQARAVAGDGAWIESKPASVVLHVRQADPARGADALAHLEVLQADIPGSALHHGSQVLEVLARPHDKGTALGALRREFAAGSIVYLGDDVPDEDAFVTLRPTDLGVKVGVGPTLAVRRLRDPAAVRDLLAEIVRGLDRGSTPDTR